MANYIKPTHEQYASHPMYRYIQVNLQENLLKSLLVSLFTSSIRKTIPEELWETYLVSSQNMECVLRSVLNLAKHLSGTHALFAAAMSDTTWA